MIDERSTMRFRRMLAQPALGRKTTHLARGGVLVIHGCGCRHREVSFGQREAVLVCPDHPAVPR